MSADTGGLQLGAASPPKAWGLIWSHRFIHSEKMPFPCSSPRFFQEDDKVWRDRERKVQKYKWSKETWPPWCPNIHWTWTQLHQGCPHSLSHTPVPHLSHPELILFFLTSLQSPAFFLGSVRQGEHWAEGVQGRIPSLPGKAASSGFQSENPVSAKFCTFTNRKSLKTPTQLCPYSKSDLKGSGW